MYNPGYLFCQSLGLLFHNKCLVLLWAGWNCPRSNPVIIHMAYYIYIVYIHILIWPAITLVLGICDILGNPWDLWHLLLSPGVPAFTFIKVPHWEYGGIFIGTPLGYIRFDPSIKSWHISWKWRKGNKECIGKSKFFQFFLFIHTYLNTRRFFLITQ